jgi:hypothetical protein
MLYRVVFVVLSSDLRNFLRNVQLDNLSGHRIAPSVIHSLPLLLSNLIFRDTGRSHYGGVWEST